jgi:hypothetical protein
LKEAESRTCIDCLHCKVSAESTAGNRQCYCGITKNPERREEVYWLGKKICKEFAGMD